MWILKQLVQLIIVGIIALILVVACAASGIENHKSVATPTTNVVIASQAAWYKK